MPQHDMPAPDEKPRRSRGGGLRFLVLIIVLIAGAAAGFLALVPHDSRDAAFISLQRHYRVWLASLGKPMPGTPDLGRLDARLAEKGLLAGAPIFMRIDFDKNAVIGAKRTTPILLKTDQTEQMLLQGHELGFGWTIAVSKTTGEMSASLVDRNGAYVLFGSCTPQ